MIREGFLGVFFKRGRPGARRRRCSSTVGVTYFGEHQAQLRRGRGPVLPQRAGSPPVTDDNGVNALTHHAARSISPLFP
jgi:hypothetical protein